jgi:RimJ/RimL family protein N-acetyltransferase
MLQTVNTYLRLVELEDADFILSLRMNEKLNQYLSPVKTEISQQINWLTHYKLREVEGSDYYFMIMNKEMGKVGLVRVYDINYNDRSCEWGSWVLAEIRHKCTALDSMLLSLEFAFNELGLNVCNLKVNNNNLHAKSFYHRFGWVQVAQDNQETFFAIKKLRYLQLKYSKYYKFLLG